MDALIVSKWIEHCIGLHCQMAFIIIHYERNRKAINTVPCTESWCRFECLCMHHDSKIHLHSFDQLSRVPFVPRKIDFQCSMHNAQVPSSRLIANGQQVNIKPTNSKRCSRKIRAMHIDCHKESGSDIALLVSLFVVCYAARQRFWRYHLKSKMKIEIEF